MDGLLRSLSAVGEYLLRPDFVFSPLYLPSTLAIVFCIWLLRGRETGFLRFLAPRELYLHPSTLLDAKLALFNTLLTASGAISALFVAPYVTWWVIQSLSTLGGELSVEPTGWARGAAAAAILFLTQDFCRYWNHYIHHTNRVLWPFHAVHHSAEVMTPVTFMRAHPVYYAIQVLLMSLLLGTAQALLLFALVGQIDFWVVYAGTLAFNAYVFLGAHLRHSHIWVSYGPVLEHLLISPSQHQVHHSSDPRHFDKNFGEVFAIWDWMFGTLYIPESREVLTFGIADADGRRIEQPHPTLRAALVHPFVEVWEEIWRGTSRDPALRPAARPDALADAFADGAGGAP